VKNTKRVIAALVSFLLMIGLAGCGLVSRTPEGEKKVVVAKGTNLKITKGDFDKRFALQSVLLELYYGDDFLTNKDNASQVAQIKSQTLDDMVKEDVIVNKAKELKLVPDDAALDKEAQSKLDEFIKDETDQTKFKKKMEDKKVTMDDFKELFKRLAIADKVYENLIKDITVSDADAQQYYNENLYDYTEKPNIMNVSHILVATEAEATSIKDKLAKGEKFEDLAKQYSTDTGSKDKGGLL
jgi:foldase protein PrsA